MESAREFAHRYEIPSAYGNYEHLLADGTVDAIYLSLPNSMHYEWTLKALAAGKHVLCEKPFATSESQATRMFAAADRFGRILVEAFMYLSHPQTHSVRDAIRSGAIGEVRLLQTSFCYRTTRLTNNIRFDASLAGGASWTLDVTARIFRSSSPAENPLRCGPLQNFTPAGSMS